MRSQNLVLVFLNFLSSCGSSNSSDTKSEAPVLAGSWVSECLVYDDFAVMNSFTFTGSSSSMFTSLFNDSGCLGLVYTDVTKSTYEFAEIEPAIPNTWRIDFTHETVTSTLNRSDIVETANNEQWYGYDDWEVSESKDIAGKSLSPDGDPEWEEESVRYDIIQVKNSTELILGDHGSGNRKTEETRPKTLRTSVVYTKQ